MCSSDSSALRKLIYSKDIMDRKVAGYILFPLLFSGCIVGLFFAVTDPSTWPEKEMRLTSTDMRVMPHSSTMLCESVLMSSDKDFLVYKSNGIPAISPKLTRHSVNFETELNRKNRRVLILKYYLLPGSVLSALACSADSEIYLYAYKGLVSRQCLHHAKKKKFDSSEYDSEDSDEDEDSGIRKKIRDICPSPVRSEYITTSDCFHSIPFSIHIVEADTYSIVVHNVHPGSNRVELKLSLDRTAYETNQSTESVRMCGGRSRCEMRFAFASQERLLVYAPPTPDAGKTMFPVYTQCRPRIALFATLIVFFPLFLFFVILYVISKNREQKKRRYRAMGYAAPLLHQCSLDRQNDRMELDSSISEGLEHRSSDPPPYELVVSMTEPPPYSSIKDERE